MNFKKLTKLISVCALLALAPSTALAGTGGSAAPQAPKIENAQCPSGEWSCAPTETLTINGQSLKSVKAVVFLGGSGKKDNRRSKPFVKKNGVIKLAVPIDASSGPLRVISKFAKKKIQTKDLKIDDSLDINTPEAVFPIDGKYEIGASEVQRFGGKRHHQGQDIFAKCGTPLVAAQGGKVFFVGYHSKAGNYIVIQLADKTSNVYMHMKNRPLVSEGDQVATGQPIGEVGDTGHAEGCHLHFELWTAPGWYQGGEAIDPLPTLKKWEKQ